MKKILLLFALFTVHSAIAQSEEYTWESIHQEHLEWMEHRGFRSKYKAALKNEYNTEAYVSKRLNYAWHLGKMDDIYVYLPKLFDFIKGRDREEIQRKIYRTIDIDDQAMTEWRRNGEMLKRVLKRFEEDSLIQEHLTPGLLFVEKMTGQFSTGIERAENYLETYSDSTIRSEVRELYLRMLSEVDEFDKAMQLSQEFYKETGDIKFLERYCSAVHSKGDPVAFLLLEDTIRKHGFYFQYFDLMRIHIERGDDEAMQFYLNWFEGSLTINSWSQGFELVDKKTTYVFANFQAKLVADYYLTRNRSKACKIYAQILRAEEKYLKSEWDLKHDASYYLAKVGTESEEAYMELWARNEKYRQELIEACEFEVSICE